MSTINPNALFIVDASYLLYRSFYGIKPLYTSAGISTNATFGFCRAIKKLIDQFAPRYLVVVWDSKGPTFRHDMYAAYKATRQTPPSDLFVQKEQILAFLKAVRATYVMEPGYEADDIIATLAKEYPDQQAVLVCPDKDMYQLLSDRVIIFDPFKDRMIDVASFTAENGFPPSKIPFYYALLGDASDNIPGVKGIGEKGAADLVKQFDSLDALYQNLDTVSKERTRNALLENRDDAFLSLDLFTLRPPPLQIPIQNLTFEKNNWKEARGFFEQMEFRSLVKAIDTQFPTNPLQQYAEQNAAAVTVTQETTLPIFAPSTWRLVTVQDQETFASLLAMLKAASTFGFDTETTGANPVNDSLVGMSFATEISTAYYIPLAHQSGKQLDKQWVLEQLKPLLENPATDVIMHNAKFDQLVMLSAGIVMPPVTFDTILAANLVRNEWQKINLKDLSLFFLHEPMKKFEEIMGKKYKTFDQVPIEEGSEYGAHDALQTLKLKPILAAMLDQEPTLKKIFQTIEMPFYYVLLRMEAKGVLLDPSVLAATAITVQQEITTVENKIFSALEALTPYVLSSRLNLNSPKQVETLLFDQLQLPVIKKSSKGGRSTDHDVLVELSRMHPIPALILRFRELAKLKNTYLDPLPTFVNKKTGRIHTNYSQTWVATGRLASSDPNLQNIPVGEGFGMQIRSAFYAESGTIFLSADYSQIELRILAYLSNDPTLIQIFQNGLDIHTQTAAQLFDVPLEAITNEQRQLGKRINFSIIYGMSPFGLAKDLDIRQSDAKLYIERYFARYPNVSAWIEKTIQSAIIKGYTETWLGRRRHIPELREKNRTLFEAGKRMAANTPVQGTQAEILKIAMIQIDNYIIQHGLKARMILQIHDEIVLELPPAEIDLVEPMVKKIMENVVQWSVPLKVSIRTGANWAQVTK